MNNLEELLRAERLSTLVYLDSLLIHRDTGSLGEVVAKMRETEKKWPCRMNQSDWIRVMNGIQKDASLKALRILKVEEIESTKPSLVHAGHRAILFGDGYGHGYVIFRGTGSDEEWEDNAKGMFETETLQQQAAARFVQQVHKQFNHVTVAGHSKGGNKAQYAAIALPDNCVNLCFSFDGQGFSIGFLEKYKEAIEKKKSTIQLVSERRGFIHALGFSISETRHYTGRRGNPQEKRPHGDPLSKFHCPDALRDAAGNLGQESMQNPISTTTNRLVTHFLKTSKYSPHWEKTALGLTSLMTQSKKIDEAAAAIAQLLMVFIDLIATDISFRKQTTEMLLKETDVLLASLDEARAAYSHEWTGALSSMGKKVTHNLAHCLIADRQVRHRFIKVIRYAIALRHVLITGRQTKLLEYIKESIHIALKILSGALKTHMYILNKIQKSLDDRKKTQEHVLELLDNWEYLEKAM